MNEYDQFIEPSPQYIQHILDISCIENENIIGYRVGKLVVIDRVSDYKYKDRDSPMWLLRCDCGNTTIKDTEEIIGGLWLRSCGMCNAKNSRNYPKYRNWRRDVFVRDGYACQKCGKIGRKLNAHHIESYDVNKDLRTELSNGATFCKKCHNKFHGIYGRGNNTREQFAKFMEDDSKDA